MEKNIKIILSAIDNATAPIKKVGTNLDSFAKKNKETFKKMAVVGTAVATSIWMITKSLFDTAKTLELMDKKATVVLWSFKSDVEDTARVVASRMWLTNQEFVNATTNMTDLLVPMWFVRGEAVAMATKTTKLAGALAEWSNWTYDATEASEILSKAMLGETEQLKQMGIKIDQSTTAFWERVKLLMEEKDLTLEQAKALDIQTQIFEKSIDAQKAYEKGAWSLVDQQQRLTIQFKNIRDTIALSLIPVFNTLLEKLAPIIDSVATWIEENPELARNILLITWVVAWLVAVVGTLWLAIPAIISWFTLLMWPVGLAIAGIIAITVAVVKLTKARKENDERISSIQKSLLDLDTAYAQGMISTNEYQSQVKALNIEMDDLEKKNRTVREYMVDWWTATGNAIMDAVNWVKDWIVGLWDKFIRLWNTVSDYFTEKLDKIVEKVKSIWDSITSITGKVWSVASNVVTKVGNAIGISWERALWWTIQAGKSYLVGENWPEIVTPSTTSNVNPSVGGAVSISVNMWGVTVNNEADENRLVEKIKVELINEVKNFNLWII